ncbi:hypothetical protein DL96DRAFT_771584 [Flagelloscypha sp. PMI_526]|nr:hypothetical protein DL96DRAFT_771584 [Flagelloscypha sp. PMI_526]
MAIHMICLSLQETILALKLSVNTMGSLTKSYSWPSSSHKMLKWSSVGTTQPLTHSLRFLYKGNRINDDDTPSSLDMEEGDSIDVMVEQVGGSFQRQRV